MIPNNYFVHNATTLRQLLNDNKNLPIIFAVDESKYSSVDFKYDFCTNFHCAKKTILSENPYYDFDYAFEDEEDLKAYIYNYHARLHNYDISNDTEFNEFIEKEVEQLKPYWIDVIVVYLD